MKCKICGRKINWDNSYGRIDFLICHPCFEELRIHYGWKTLDFICDIGFMIEKNKKDIDK